MRNIAEELQSLEYHGRGIILGKSTDGKKAVIAYFIMGRSENSRNRVFVTDGDGIRTQAFDESKMVDPHLIIYAPVRVLGNKTIVTNGDQTDTIYEGMDKQLTFEQSLRTREYEPDGPNYTPRISGIMNIEDGNMELKINSIVGSMNEEIDITKSGKDLMIGFNPKFLIDALRVIDDEEIDIYLVNPKAPCFIRDAEQKYIYLILPVNFINVQ